MFAGIAPLLTACPAAMLAMVENPQSHVSIVKILVMLVFLTPWWLASPWVYQDAKSRQVRAPSGIWGGVVLGSGALGVLAWLLIPEFLLGLAIYVVMVAAALGSYVVYRNGRVPAEEFKILTGEHLGRVFSGKKRQASGPQVLEKVKVYRQDGGHIEPPRPDDPPTVAAYNTVQDLLSDIIWHRASIADVAPTSQGVRVRFMIDGVVSERPGLEAADADAAAQYLKGVSGMDIEERRRPQKGRIKAEVPGTGVKDVMLTMTGSTGGQRIQIQVIDELVRTRIEELGMPEEMLKRLDEINLAESGLIIVSARPGNGQTSTLYSLLRRQDAFIHQLVTLEADPEIDLDNIAQTNYGKPEDLPGRFAATLRLDPDVIMLDQCPSDQLASQIDQAAGEFFILLGITASDTFSALAKWVRLAGPRSLERLHAIVAQVLVRKLCTECREAYRPDPAMLAKVNLGGRDNMQFYRPPTRPLVDEKGNPYTCLNCQGAGYVGRTAVFELLEITDELRQIVATGGTLMQIKATARKNKMRYLQEQALRKVIDGTTSIQEVIRVTQQPQAKR